jgi:c-di-GMP-binding flagellar brake protein YcgR
VSPDQHKQPDRRHADRFSIQREVRYKLLNHRGAEETGDGRTVNISSSGVLFTTETRLPTGRRVELSISWPAKLDDRCGLQLMARGRVVRFENGLAAVEIQQHEFRTQSAAPTQTNLSVN